MTAKFVTISRRDRDYFASVDGGVKFFVGRKVSYENNWGLANSAKPPIKYNPDDYRAKYGFWADFIHPTAECESKGGFQCLNTYDRAQFTFGFMQYAAHVPDGDFVKFFRRLLQTPEGAQYFPDLSIRDGAICRETESGVMRLETPHSVENLMNYLNPSLASIDDIEVINAAKFIHWANNDIRHRDAQVDCAVIHFKERTPVYSKRYSLNGASDLICLVIADIRHQGRAKSQEIISALSAPDERIKLKNLLELGRHRYPSRIETLGAMIRGLTARGALGGRRYNAEENEFV